MIPGTLNTLSDYSHMKMAQIMKGFSTITTALMTISNNLRLLIEHQKLLQTLFEMMKIEACTVLTGTMLMSKFMRPKTQSIIKDQRLYYCHVTTSIHIWDMKATLLLMNVSQIFNSRQTIWVRSIGLYITLRLNSNNQILKPPSKLSQTISTNKLMNRNLIGLTCRSERAS